MIIYDLECDSGHRFEGWFKDSGDYDGQMEKQLLSCPLCDSRVIRKVPTASHISTRAKQRQSIQQDSSMDPLTLLRKFHDYVDRNFQDVGRQFHEEAIRIHQGETPQRNIRGTATQEEMLDLQEAGIAVTALPPKPVAKEKLN